jgi:hypothetical protein
VSVCLALQELAGRGQRVSRVGVDRSGACIAVNAVRDFRISRILRYPLRGGALWSWKVEAPIRWATAEFG